MTLVRPATAADLPAIAAIYDDEVRHGIATFATEPPGLDYWRERLHSTHPGDHLLVAEREGVVIGYAYSGTYRPRTAYAQTRETSVYLAAPARGAGVGRALYDAITSHDFAVIQGFVFVIAIGFLLVNLIVDISYAWLDPRIRLS